jgi:hypothetical protein
MVESRMGSGTTFTVTLPADPRTSANAVATGAVSPKSAAPATAAIPPTIPPSIPPNTPAAAEAVADSAKTQTRTQAT